MQNLMKLKLNLGYIHHHRLIFQKLLQIALKTRCFLRNFLKFEILLLINVFFNYTFGNNILKQEGYTSYCHSLVLILILISIKTRINHIFGQNTTPPHPPTTNSTLLNIAQTINISDYSSKQKLLIYTTVV